MNIKQVDAERIETCAINGDTVIKHYYPIDSEKGQALILEYNLVIDPEMEEF